MKKQWKAKCKGLGYSTSHWLWWYIATAACRKGAWTWFQGCSVSQVCGSMNTDSWAMLPASASTQEAAKVSGPKTLTKHLVLSFPIPFPTTIPRAKPFPEFAWIIFMYMWSEIDNCNTKKIHWNVRSTWLSLLVSCNQTSLQAPGPVNYLPTCTDFHKINNFFHIHRLVWRAYRSLQNRGMHALWWWLVWGLQRGKCCF